MMKNYTIVYQSLNGNAIDFFYNYLTRKKCRTSIAKNLDTETEKDL